MFHAFHYPFTLRLPPRWLLIHGCLRFATVRLLMHREKGVVPRCWRAWHRPAASVAAITGPVCMPMPMPEHKMKLVGVDKGVVVEADRGVDVDVDGVARRKGEGLAAAMEITSARRTDYGRSASTTIHGGNAPAPHEGEREVDVTQPELGVREVMVVVEEEVRPRRLTPIANEVGKPSSSPTKAAKPLELEEEVEAAKGADLSNGARVDEVVEAEVEVVEANVKVEVKVNAKSKAGVEEQLRSEAPQSQSQMEVEAPKQELIHPISSSDVTEEKTNSARATRAIDATA